MRIRNIILIVIAVSALFLMAGCSGSKNTTAVETKNTPASLNETVNKFFKEFTAEEVNWDKLYDSYWDESFKIWRCTKDTFVERNKKATFEGSVKYIDYLIGTEKNSSYGDKFKIVPVSLKYTEKGFEKTISKDTVWVNTDKGWKCSYEQTYKSQQLAAHNPADNKLTITPTEAIYSQKGIYLITKVTNKAGSDFSLGWTDGYNIKLIADGKTYIQHFPVQKIPKGLDKTATVLVEGAAGDITEISIDNIYGLNPNGSLSPTTQPSTFTIYKK
jgi:hypothetical protein